MSNEIGKESIRIELFSVFVEIKDIDLMDTKFKFNGEVYQKEESIEIQELLQSSVSEKIEQVRKDIIKYNIKIYRKQLDNALQKNENNLQAEEVQQLSKVIDSLTCKLDAKVASEEIKTYIVNN